MCFGRGNPFVSVISNTNLEVAEPDVWRCERLTTLELTARTVYYVARLLRYLEPIP